MLGVASGISLAVYTQTESGQEWLETIRDKTDKATDTIKSKLDSINEGVSSLVKKEKNNTDDAQSAINNTVDEFRSF